MTVLFLRRYITRPLHLFGMLGGAALRRRLPVGDLPHGPQDHGQAIGRRPLLTLGILLMVVGVQFISFGLLGEMVANHQRATTSSYPRRGNASARKDGGLADNA